MPVPVLMRVLAGRLAAVAVLAPAATAAAAAAPAAIGIATIIIGGVAAFFTTGALAALLAIGPSFARGLAVAFVVADGFAVGIHRLLVAGRRGIVAVLGGGLRTVLAFALRAIVVAAAAAPATPAAPAVAAVCTFLVACQTLALALALGAGLGGVVDFGLIGGERHLAGDRVIARAGQLLGRPLVVAARTHAFDLAVGGMQLVVGLDGDVEGVALLDLAQRRGASG